jgi:hypothetical protein
MAHLKLPFSFFRRGIDPRSLKTSQMLVPKVWIDNMERLFSALDPFPDERQQHTVFLFVGVKESTHMPVPSKRSPCEMNTLVIRLHRTLPLFID